jgi:hypothetical protein
MDLRAHYKSVISGRDYKYFHTYSDEDQASVVEEARNKLHMDNVRRMKDCIRAASITSLLGFVSHVSSHARNIQPRYLDKPSSPPVLLITAGNTDPP